MEKCRPRLKVLIACECSQTICNEFRVLGDECYSCDIEKEYGSHPEWHIQSDCLPLLHGDCAFTTNDGQKHNIDGWDLIIAHPPCTFLSRVQALLYNRERFGDEYVQNRLACRKQAIEFFMKFTTLKSATLIENPIGYMNSHYRKPDQVIHPYQFGDPVKKATCLWLFGLPQLEHTKLVQVPEPHRFPSSNAMDLWYYETSKLPRKERSRIRSKTFPGIAKAIATQYHDFLIGRKHG